ncbi:MAG: [protein-PII] uridylyltransferase [Alphaproteobacteria bacterium]
MTLREVENPRAIIDRKALVEAIEPFRETATAPKGRNAVLGLLKEALRRGEAKIRADFQAAPQGEKTVRARAYLVDQIVRLVHDFAADMLHPVANPTAGERLSVVAVGGYGRGELAPFSDIDLLFLRPYKRTPRTEQVVESMLYLLWDLGLKLGHSTRSVDECIRLSRGDGTIRTAVLEARWIWGDQKLCADLKRRFHDDLASGTAREFVEMKLAERDARHARMGDSRYVLEPNIKDGKGGLRDLHTLLWIAKYVYGVDQLDQLVERRILTRHEVHVFERAQTFLWTVRCQLHYLAGRPEERLTFEVQQSIADRLGYTDHAGSSEVERFMKRYFLTAKEVGDLTRIFCATLEAEQTKSRFRIPRLRLRREELGGFTIESGRLTYVDEGKFLDDPRNLLRLFRVAQRHKVDIHPRALQVVSRNLRLVDKALREDEEANRLFLEMLTGDDPEPTLRRFSEAGVFGRFVPEFGRIVAQMQYNMYHVYTVDEHTIYAIGILARIERGELAEELPLATGLVQKLVSRRVLYVALLLHDIAKGRGGDHSELGARVAHKLCPRLGMSAEETETVAWLVLHHLVMSETAFKRDLGDPKTIEDFVHLVQSPERLRLLLALTVADIRAVGPHIWNGWKASLLRELYHVANEAMVGGLEVDAARERVARKLAELRARLSDWPETEFAAHVARGFDAYWLSYDVDTLAAHARQVRAAEIEDLPLSVHTRVDREKAVTEVTIYTYDQPGLFSRISGALTVAGADVVDARIHTLNNGRALDTFRVQDTISNGGVPAAFDRPDRLAKLASHLEQSFRGRLRVKKVMTERTFQPKRNKVFKVAPRVLIDQKASATCTVIEVNGADRPGLLYALTRALAERNIVICSAKISTFGERAVDVFYVQDLFGTKIMHESKLAAVRRKLLSVLGDGPETPAAEPAPAAAASGQAAA